MIVEELSLLIQQVYCIWNVEATCRYWSKTVTRCYKHYSCVSVAAGSEPLRDTVLVGKKYSSFWSLQKLDKELQELPRKQPAWKKKHKVKRKYTKEMKMEKDNRHRKDKWKRGALHKWHSFHFISAVYSAEVHTWIVYLPCTVKGEVVIILPVQDYPRLRLTWPV